MGTPEDKIYESYKAGVLEYHSIVDNLTMRRRFDGGNGLANVAQMHPVNIMEIYPKVGGVFGKLAMDLGTMPNPSLDFKNSASDWSPDSNNPKSKPIV